MKYLILITTISIMACTQTQVADRAEDSENFERNHLDKMITLIKLYWTKKNLRN